MTHRERFMAALRGEKTDRVPVFPLLMFLAIDRAGITYREYATNGRALAEAQLLVQERFDLDAITACSDAFRVSGDLAPVLGGEMVYPEDKPPYLRNPLIPQPQIWKSWAAPILAAHRAEWVIECLACLNWWRLPPGTWPCWAGSTCLLPRRAVCAASRNLWYF